MEKALEDLLCQAVLDEDQDAVSQQLLQGANPNKTTSLGKTSLGEAACIGNVDIVKLLIDASKTRTIDKTYCIDLKQYSKSHKRKLSYEEKCDETSVKYKNLSDRTYDDYYKRNGGLSTQDHKLDKNQGYFVFIHSEGSSSEEGRVPTVMTPPSLIPSPQADLEWDEEIGNVAPTTSEDETWSSMYKWYAAILESTGAAIASASAITYGINQQDLYTKTALHYAALQGHAWVVKLLLDAGCKIDVTSGDGFTPLHVAVVKNNAEVVRMLLNAGSHVNYKTHEKMTPLHFAASRGYLDMVKILVNNGAYLEARDANERTALYLAANRGHIQVVKFLISSGSNINCEEIHGYTPLCEGVWQGYVGVVEVLLASGARITHSHKLLLNAIIKGKVEIVKMLANLGGGINLHNDNGDTPLLLASRTSQPAMARTLLENGANVNSSNSITGSNALHIAVESVMDSEQFEGLLVCLAEYGIDMDAIALTGDTPLNRALLLHKDHAAVLLIRYGADVNACDLHTCGVDNMSIASKRHSMHLSSMLLKAGHYVVPPDTTIKIPKTGSTANWLYYACKEPLSLSDLCRIKIRNSCKHKILFRSIESLHLPKSLKRYLMMEDLGV